MAAPVAAAVRGASSRLVVVAIAAAGLWLRLGPARPVGLLDLSETTSTVVVDRRGEPLYEALSGDGTRSIQLAADRLPPTLVAATIAAEDRRFWSHPGVDPIAIARGAAPEPGRRPASSRADRRSRSRSPSCSSAGRSPGRTARRGARRSAKPSLALRLEHRFDEARDPRALSEPGALRQPDRRRRAGQPRLLRTALRRC